MGAINVHGTKQKNQRLVKLSKQTLPDGAYLPATKLHAVALIHYGRDNRTADS